jgi:hypothetical protein
MRGSDQVSTSEEVTDVLSLIDVLPSNPRISLLNAHLLSPEHHHHVSFFCFEAALQVM